MAERPARGGRLRRWVVRPVVWAFAALALAIAGLLLLVGSDFFRGRLADFVAARVSETLARPVSVARARLDLLPLGIELEGLVVGGATADAPPLATVRRLEIDGDLEGLRRSHLRLLAVRVEGLDLRLNFDEQGRDDLPRIAAGGSGGLSIAIDGLEIVDSTFLLADRRVPLALDAAGVVARLTATGPAALGGSVAAERVRIELPGARPYEATVAAEVALGPRGIDIRSARVAGRDLSIRARGRVSWRPQLDVTLAVEADTRGEWLDRLGWTHGEVAGEIGLSGTLTWRPEAWGYRARVRSPRVSVVGFAIEELSGIARGEAKKVSLELESARYGGGALAGGLEVGLGSTALPARLEVTFDGADLDRLLADLSVPLDGFSGRVSGPFRYDFDFRRARSGTGDGVVSIVAGDAADGRLPIAGGLGVAIADGEIELSQVALVARGQTIDGEGAFSLPSGIGRFDLQVASGDLGELARLMPFYAAEEPEAWLPFAGRGALGLGLDLAAGEARAAIELDLFDVEAPGFAADRATGRFGVDANAVDDLDLELLRVRDGARLNLVGRVPLTELEAAHRPLALSIDATRWPLVEARPWLPFDLPASGPVDGHLELGGTLAAISGSATVVVSPAEVAGLTLDRLSVDLDFDPAAVTLRSVEAVVPAGTVTGAAQIDLATEAIEGRFAGRALRLDQPPLDLGWGERLQGTVDLRAELGGSLARPRLEIAGDLAGLALAGRALPEATGWRLLVDGERIEVDLRLPGVFAVAGEGRFAAGTWSGDLDLSEVDLAALVTLATGASPTTLGGALAGTIHFARSQGSPFELDFRSSSAAVSWQGRKLEALEPVELALVGDRISVRSLFLGERATGAELFLAGDVELGEKAGLDLALEASFDASWLAPWLGDSRLDGAIELLSTLKGTFDRPELNGQGRLADGGFVLAGFPHAVERLQALVLFDRELVVADRVSGLFAGGKLVGGGELHLPGRESAEASYRFRASLDDVSVRYPQGWLLEGDGDLTLSSLDLGRQVRGVVRLDRLVYLQDLEANPTDLLRRFLARRRIEAIDTDETLASTYLNVELEAPGALRVRNNIADLHGSADLVLRGTLAQPILFGEVVAEEGGTVEWAGNEYVLDRAIVTFANPVRIDPALDIVAHAKVAEYDVRVNLSGTLERMNTAFSSDPPLADLEILGLLATGRASSEGGIASTLATSPGSPTTLAAEGFLYGQAASLISERVNQLFGLDKVRIDPLTAGDSVSALRVTVGKRLSRKLYVTYSYDPSSTAQQILEVEWRISDNLVLVLTQNGNDSYSVDARWDSAF